MDKNRSAAQDLSSGIISTITAPGQTTIDDDAWPCITDNMDNPRQDRNMSRSSVARTVQSNRKSFAIHVDIADDCQKSTKRDDSSQDPSTAAARDRSRDRPRDRACDQPRDRPRHRPRDQPRDSSSYDVSTLSKSYDQRQRDRGDGIQAAQHSQIRSEDEDAETFIDIIVTIDVRRHDVTSSLKRTTQQ